MLTILKHLLMASQAFASNCLELPQVGMSFPQRVGAGLRGEAVDPKAIKSVLASPSTAAHGGA